MTQSFVFLAYIPVLHQGYLQFFSRHPEVKKLYLIGSEFANQYRSLQKDLRALSPEQMQSLIQALNLFEKVEVVRGEELKTENTQVIMPDEEVSHDFAEQHLDSEKVQFDNIFLRWDRTKSLTGSDIEPDVTISSDEFDQKMMVIAYEEASKSSDWWRQTAAVLVNDNKVLATARNRHVPQDTQQYVDGDPRAAFGSGEHIDLSSSIHAEAAVIASAARQGIKTEGCWLYATTFPCPYCAPIVVAAGITKLFYSEGYSMIEGEEMLKSKGIEIIKVNR
ncbi:MAG: deaminase [Patescibacteria group bacterium]